MGNYRGGTRMLGGSVVHWLSTQSRIMALFWIIAACCGLFNRLKKIEKMTGNQGFQLDLCGLKIRVSAVQFCPWPPKQQGPSPSHVTGLFLGLSGRGQAVGAGPANCCFVPAAGSVRPCFSSGLPSNSRNPAWKHWPAAAGSLWVCSNSPNS